MDKGAHYYRCDFQVHTPRDPQWTGAGAATDTERQAYAAAFIAACREKGLHGVAISDHHDMAFVPYIREAAKNERDDKGRVIPATDRIAVFPAMELTLAVPCQAIVIFDAEFPGDLFSLAMNALTINQNPPVDTHGKQAERLSILSLSALCSKLDEHEYLRGRYILLPNVSEKGTATLMRSGYSTHYREMPCVGAYLDGDCGQLGRGNLTILSGRNAEYGSKRVALFQTSDNRRRDFAELGVHSTWVKWAASFRWKFPRGLYPSTYGWFDSTSTAEILACLNSMDLAERWTTSRRLLLCWALLYGVPKRSLASMSK